MVSCNGGLNQMRAAICDMVAIARYLNVTLIVPELDKNSFWAASEFQDIFDVNHFIRSLRDEVRILKKLPPKLNKRAVYSLPPVRLEKAATDLLALHFVRVLQEISYILLYLSWILVSACVTEVSEVSELIAKHQTKLREMTVP